jgi:hypothetical protein
MDEDDFITRPKGGSEKKKEWRFFPQQKGEGKRLFLLDLQQVLGWRKVMLPDEGRL